MGSTSRWRCSVSKCSKYLKNILEKRKIKHVNSAISLWSLASGLNRSITLHSAVAEEDKYFDWLGFLNVPKGGGAAAAMGKKH